jgi:hypothetical protein
MDVRKQADGVPARVQRGPAHDRAAPPGLWFDSTPRPPNNIAMSMWQ